MTYTEWRDELKSNLLSVSESERRRVLEYYAEAYADRREAGFSEREIIEEFGAPYDAAQRILSEVKEDAPQTERSEEHAPSKEEGAHPVEKAEEPKPEANNAEGPKKKGKTNWLFVLLCVIFAIPIFMIALTLVVLTVVAFAAPFLVVLSGIGEIVSGIGAMFSNVFVGLIYLGYGLILCGIGVILITLLPRLVKLLRKALKKVGSSIKSLFTEEA